MYESFFGLTAKPFSLVPDPSFLFLSATHKKALRYLQYGLQEGAGFILLTGEVGSGKTTILKDFVQRLDGDTVLAMVFNTSLGGEQLLAAVNEEFGLEVDGRDKLSLQRDLNDFLIYQYAESVRPILIVDEAQNLSTESLEEIRLLSNLETGGHKLLQIILVGQPELQEILGQHNLRQLRQRIAVSCHLSALSLEEIEEYILYRLEKAGNRDALSFEIGSMEIIYRHSGGIPRLINRICDFLLLAAFGEETLNPSLELVIEVAGEVGDEAALAQGEKYDSDPINEGVQSRMVQLETDFARMLSGDLEKERIFEKLTLFENVLKKMIKKQQFQFEALEESIDKLSTRLEQVEKKRGFSLVK
jgi:putative secretion ATPase (PEP-CTERM system associated)